MLNYTCFIRQFVVIFQIKNIIEACINNILRGEERGKKHSIMKYLSLNEMQ